MTGMIKKAFHDGSYDITLKNNEKEMVLRNVNLFEEAGFIIEEFSDNTIKVSGVPNIGYDIDYTEMFKDILEEFKVEE